MAIRLATLATVPVKRFWSAVNPVSNGEPLCASAATGKRSNRERKIAGSGNRRRAFARAIPRRREVWIRVNIGTSDGQNVAVMCRS